MVEEGLIVFPSTHEAIKADDLCQSLGLQASLIPTHPSITLGCGFMMKTTWNYFSELLVALEKHNVAYKALYYSTKQGIKRNVITLYELDKDGRK